MMKLIAAIRLQLHLLRNYWFLGILINCASSHKYLSCYRGSYVHGLLLLSIANGSVFLLFWFVDFAITSMVLTLIDKPLRPPKNGVPAFEDDLRRFWDRRFMDTLSVKDYEFWLHCLSPKEVAAAISFPLSQVEVVDKASDFNPFEETPAPAPKPNTNCSAPVKPAPSSIC
ncbi:hypothetical protein LXL04_032814 [Taraxacum kok-saghyz]